MLSRQLKLQIEAYIDGDLTPAQRSEVEKLLSSSDEAQSYHRDISSLRSALAASAPADPGEAYWNESASLILAKTSNREPVFASQEQPRPSHSLGLRRAMFTAAASIAILITALSVGSQDTTNYAVVQIDNRQYLVASDIMNKVTPSDEVTAQVETARSAESAVLISSPGSVGRAAQPLLLSLAY